MVIIRHAINHRNTGGGGKGEDTLVSIDASHNDIAHAAKDLGGIADSFVSTELDGTGSEVKSVPP